MIGTISLYAFGFIGWFVFGILACKLCVRLTKIRMNSLGEIILWALLFPAVIFVTIFLLVFEYSFAIIKKVDKEDKIQNFLIGFVNGKVK